MKIGQDLSLSAWLAKKDHLKEMSRIGVDPKLYSVAEYQSLEEQLRKSESKHKLISLEPNLVDEIWENRPSPPHGRIFTLEKKFSGKDIIEKIHSVREEMKKENCYYLILTALDEIAWLTNLRGSDISYNPVFMSYVLIALDKIILYVDSSKFDPYVPEHLGVEITVKPYDSFLDDLSSIFSKEINGKIWVDTTTCNMGVFERLPKDKVFAKISPVKLAKSIKNEIELQGFRNSHIRDGIALVRFFAWLEFNLNNNEAEKITEVSAANKLEQFRREQEHFIGLSFNTISGFGPNGAIIHYAPQPDSCATITKDNIYLLDSGAQYKDGTTDVTRTVHFGQPTSHQKECYTRVLKGHIALDRVTFPEGTSGFKLDIIARLPLWEIGLDYNHGTGHGVGHFLNVHEGPHGIGTRVFSTNEFPLKVGMTVTNEPGYYEDGAFGIRIENVEIVVEKQTPFNFGNKKSIGLEPVTMCPIQTKLIDPSLLSQAELDWVNNYNKKCHDLLKDHLTKDELALKWLVDNTKPISP
jgi:Xaa-Pro aminopeptidase